MFLSVKTDSVLLGPRAFLLQRGYCFRAFEQLRGNHLQRANPGYPPMAAMRRAIQVI